MASKRPNDDEADRYENAGLIHIAAEMNRFNTSGVPDGKQNEDDDDEEESMTNRFAGKEFWQNGHASRREFVES